MAQGNTRGTTIPLTHQARARTVDDRRQPQRHQPKAHKKTSSTLPSRPTTQSIETDDPSNESRSRSSNCNGSGAPDMGIKTITMNNSHLLQTVEIRKRPGQSLGFYIREGNGTNRQDGVFISRIQMGTVADSNGLLHVGDEILAVNKVEVTRMSLDDVVILMSIPKKLILKIKTKKHGHKKNASCPSLPLTEKDEEPPLPIVVLKKGRSCSATALEETEKCPDMFDPESEAATTDYIGHRRYPHPKPPTSQYASIFITPHKAEAKLLNEDGDSEHSSEGSLPRSIDSGGKVQYVGHRGYLSDSGYDPGGLYISPNSISPSQYGSSLDRDYIKYMYSDGGLPRSKFAPKPVPKTMGVVQQPPLPPRSYIGTSDSSERIIPPNNYGSQDYVNIRMLEQQRQALYQGGNHFREIIHSKSKYNRIARARSPECYNSDSEVIYAPPSRGHADSRGFSSDYETYAGAVSDDDPIYAVPQIPCSSSTELEELLRKFNSLSHELQQEQNKLHRQISSKDKTGENLQ